MAEILGGDSAGRGQEAANNEPLGFWYSFDMLVPVIRLREQHYDVELGSRVKYYFFLHKILGCVLVSAVIAAINAPT